MPRLGALPVSSGVLVFSTCVLEHTARGTWKKCRCPRNAGRIFYVVEVQGSAPSLSSSLFTLSFLGSLPLPHSLSGTSGHFSFFFNLYPPYSYLPCFPLLSSSLLFLFLTALSKAPCPLCHVSYSALFSEHKERSELPSEYIIHLFRRQQDHSRINSR